MNRHKARKHKPKADSEDPAPSTAEIPESTPAGTPV